MALRTDLQLRLESSGVGLFNAGVQKRTEEAGGGGVGGTEIWQ